MVLYDSSPRDLIEIIPHLISTRTLHKAVASTVHFLQEAEVTQHGAELGPDLCSLVLSLSSQPPQPGVGREDPRLHSALPPGELHEPPSCTGSVLASCESLAPFCPQHTAAEPRFGAWEEQVTASV